MSEPETDSPELSSNKKGGEVDGVDARKAATHFFLVSAPPGARGEATENCELVVDDPTALSTRFLAATFEKSVEEQMQVVTFTHPQTNETTAAVICAAAKVGKAQFLYPPSKFLLSIGVSGTDLNVTTSPAPSGSFPEDLEPQRLAVENALTSYVKERFACSTLRQPSLRRAVCVFSHHRQNVEPHPALVAVVSTAAGNPSAYWAASWAAEWRIFFRQGSSEARIEGSVNVRCYLNEDASVQAYFTRNFGSSEGSDSRASEAAKGDASRMNKQSEQGEDAEKPNIKAEQDAEKSSKSESEKTGKGCDVCTLHDAAVDTPELLAEQIVRVIRKCDDDTVEEIDKFFATRALKYAKAAKHSLGACGKPFDWKQTSLQLKPQKLAPQSNF